MIAWTRYSETNPSISAVQAKDESIRASYQSGEGPFPCRWMKSVSKYGAFGKKSSHTAISATTRGPPPRRADANARAAAMRGIQARKRFQNRNVYRWSWVAWIWATSVPIESRDAA